MVVVEKKELLCDVLRLYRQRDSDTLFFLLEASVF